MRSDRWKRHEREIAKALGAKRNPNSGEHRTDIDAGPFAVEVKTRKSLPVLIIKAMAQVKAAARDGQTPIVVLSEGVQGRKGRRYVVMEFSDFVDWHGRLEPELE